jgi:putative FmdB family regulatory protein
MPTYEFVCPDGHTFDKFYRKISDAVSELPCTVCGKPATRKISGGAGLHFKGSGFYITDYGKDGKKGAPTAPSASTGGDGAKGSGGSGNTAPATSTSESKPAASPKTASSE